MAQLPVVGDGRDSTSRGFNDGYMYPDDALDPYLQDADILDRPDLFYGPGKSVETL